MESCLERFRVESVDAFKRPKGVQPGLRRFAFREDALEGCRDALIIAFHQHALCGVPDPAVLVRQKADQLARLLGEFDCLGLGFVRNDAVDATKIDRILKLPLLDVRREVLGKKHLVLDDSTRHVHDIEGAVWTRDSVDRTESFVGRCEKL